MTPAGLAIAIAVDNIDEASETFQLLLDADPPLRAKSPEHGVEVATFKIGGARLQLIAPLSDGSPIAAFLSERGSGLHHVGLLVEDIEPMLARLRDAGVRTLGEAIPGAEGLPTVFLHPKSSGGVLIELLQIEVSDSDSPDDPGHVS